MGSGTKRRRPPSSSSRSEEEDEREMPLSSSLFSLDPDEDNGDEMEIYLKIIKTVSLKVKKSNKIRDVTAKFKGVGGSHLFYSGKHLEDEETLADHDISTGSTLHLFLHPGTKMRISVMNPWIKKKIEFDVMRGDAIHEVKVKIYGSTRIPVHYQNILYDGILLEDQRTLADYGVEDESILLLIQFGNDQINVDLSIPDEEKIRLCLRKQFSALNVRQIAESIWSTSLDQHGLIHDGVSLTDDYTLDKCHEQYNTLRFVVRKPLSIYVETDLRKTLYQVQSSNTVIEVLDKIKLLKETDELRLFFSGRELADYEALAECQVGEGSILKLVIVTEKIFVKTYKGQCVTIRFKSTDTVETIQRKIKHKEGTPIHQQRLVFAGSTLESSRTLASYDVKDGSTLHLSHRMRGC